MIKCYLFDIDGTLADCTHRLPHIQGETKDWDAFFAACNMDTPIEHICELAHSLMDAGNTIVFVSGRSDQCRTDTERWLDRNGFTMFSVPPIPLYMRRAGDHRPDHIVKAELLDQILEDGYEPIMAFDDRARVVAMWRERGIPCAQVADGDF